MDERTCVCGHGESDHHGVVGCMKCFGCGRLRPVLSWPDAEGWWYMQSEEYESLSYARLMDGQLVAAVALYETYRDECGREEFIKKHGPAKFTKCEPNPLTKG